MPEDFPAEASLSEAEANSYTQTDEELEKFLDALHELQANAETYVSGLSGITQNTKFALESIVGLIDGLLTVVDHRLSVVQIEDEPEV